MTLEVKSGATAPYQQASQDSLLDDKRTSIEDQDLRLDGLERNFQPIIVKRVKEDYRVIPSVFGVLADAAPQNIRIQLPKAVDMRYQTLFVKKIDASANTVTIEANYPEQIDGAATLVQAAQYKAHQLYSDGLKWHLIAVF